MRRLHIPAMRREILYIIVKPATVDGQTIDGVFHPTAADLEDKDWVKRNLINGWRDNTGFHFLLSPQGQVWHDIMLQHPGNSSPGYNADGIIIGCLAVLGEDGKIKQQVTQKQQMVASAMARTLMRVFPKATFKMGDSYTMNCKAEDIYNPETEKEEDKV